MQKQFFGFIFSLVVLSFLFAFSPAYNSINWKQTSIEFGKIQKGKPVTARYEFVNTGKKPVMIQSAKGSGGCTGVE